MADKAHRLTDLKLEEMEKRLSAIYSEAQKDIQKKADEYFSKFNRKDEEYRKKYESKKMTADEYKKWQHWRRSKITYGKRYTALKEQIATQLLHVNEMALAYVNGKLPEVYAINYNALAGDVDGVGGYSFTLVDADTVKNLATTDTSLLPYKKLDPKKDIPWNMKNINSQVLQGIIQGESMNEIAERILNVQKMNKTQAIRSARTIVTGAENKGRQDSYTRAEADGIILQKEWIATNDSRTRHWHNELDGQLRDQDKPFENAVGKIMYPGDPSADGENIWNCRCTMAAKVMGFKQPRIQRQGLLSMEDTIQIAKTFAKELNDNPDLLNNGYHGYASIKNYIDKKIGYDGLPKVIDNSEFEKISKDKKTLFRGVVSSENKTAKQIVDEYKYGELWSGSSGGAICGRGTYFSGDMSVANKYAGYGEGEIITAVLSDDARIADFRTIQKEFFETGIPKIIGNAKEDYQNVIRDIGSYASIKGYDAIALNGYQGHDHFVILNRTKMIIKK